MDSLEAETHEHVARLNNDMQEFPLDSVTGTSPADSSTSTEERPEPPVEDMELVGDQGDAHAPDSTEMDVSFMLNVPKRGRTWSLQNDLSESRTVSEAVLCILHFVCPFEATLQIHSSHVCD